MPNTRVRNPQTGHEIEWDGYQWVDITPQRESGFAIDAPHGPDPVADRQVYAAESKGLAADRDALGRQMPNRAQLDRFDAVNETVGTGVGRAIPGLGQIMQAMSPQVQELAGITSGLQGQARPVGSGSTSDFEQRLYRQGVPSPEKAGPVNANITTYMRSVMDAEQDRVAFLDAYMRKNGTLSGSSEAWGRYLSANPYTQRHGGTETPNSRRLPWREYFHVDASPVGAPPRGSRGNPVTGLTDAQVEALPDDTYAVSSRGVISVGARNHPHGLGRQAPGVGVGVSLSPRPAPRTAATGGQQRLTPEQAAKLTKGTRFIGMDGVARVRQ